MTSTKLTLAALTCLTLMSLAFSACNDDKIHSATDGGNVGEVKNSANNEDTTSTLNVANDSLLH